MKSKTILLLIIFIILFTVTIVAAVKNEGAKDIEIYGGSKEKIPFPHHMHQTNLEDCNICHSLFPQKPNSINDLKTKGQLKKKQVMRKLCIKCHKTEKRAGNKTGPTKCSKCHIK